TSSFAHSQIHDHYLYGSLRIYKIPNFRSIVYPGDSRKAEPVPVGPLAAHIGPRRSPGWGTGSARFISSARLGDGAGRDHARVWLDPHQLTPLPIVDPVQRDYPGTDSIGGAVSSS